MAYESEHTIRLSISVVETNLSAHKMKAREITQFGQGYLRKSSWKGRSNSRDTGVLVRAYQSKAGGGGKDRFQKRYRPTIFEQSLCRVRQR